MDHIAPVVTKILEDYDRRAAQAHTCLACKWLDEPEAGHRFHRCKFCVVLPSAALPVKWVSVSREHPFANCPTWELREIPIPEAGASSAPTEALRMGETSSEAVGGRE